MAGLHTLDPDYLQAAVSDLTVPVAENPAGEYFDADGMYGEITLREMAWCDLVEAVFTPTPGDPVRYLRQRPLANFGALVDDVETPPFLPRPPVLTNLWVGAAPSVTATHYDAEDNILVQVSGRKQLTLYPAAQRREMYPFSVIRGAFNHSQVDIERPDLERFERFERATAYECTLDAGEMLYIPIHWWHQVRTVRSGVSVNFWWKPLPRQARRVSGLRFLPASARAGHLPYTISTMMPERAGSLLLDGYEQLRSVRRRLPRRRGTNRSAIESPGATGD